MPLVFLAPALLAALATLIVPVLLHLRRRERERPTRFPSLMFLRQVKITTARRRRITDLPLLLLRAALVGLLVLAFARPVHPPRPDPRHAIPSRRVVVLFDRSMSMTHDAVWCAAQDSARAIINALPADDRVGVISFADQATVDQPLTTDHAAAALAVTRLRPGTGGTHDGAALRAGRELLEREADRSGGELVLVTDMQRSGATAVAGTSLPAGVTVRVVDAARAGHANAAVVGADVHRIRGSDSTRGTAGLTVQIASHGNRVAQHRRVSFLLNGRSVASRDVTLPSDGNASVSFDPVPAPAGVLRMTAALDADSLALDDTLRMVVPAELDRHILLLAPADVSAGEVFYLERAIETGGEPRLRVDRRAVGNVDATALRDAAAVIVWDAAVPKGSAGTALASWIHNGGGMIVVASSRVAAHGLSDALLPAAGRGSVDRDSDRGASLGAVAGDHPVFAPFRGANASAALDVARFLRYDRLAPSADAQVLARFDDGTPALFERQEGSGRILVVAMPLDVTSSDFPLQPTYLPFVRALVTYASGNEGAPLWRTVGDIWQLPSSTRNPVVRTPSGKVLRPELVSGRASLVLDEAGIYDLYDGHAGGDPLGSVAVNPSPRESDLTRIQAADLLVGVTQDSITASNASVVSLADAERRQHLWRLVLVAAAALALFEVVLSGLGWRGTAANIVASPVEGETS